LDSKKNKFYDPSYINIKLNIKSLENNTLIEKIPISFKACDFNYFNNSENFKYIMNNENYDKFIFDKLIQQKYFCPEFNNELIFGNWIENKINFLQISLYKCENTTENAMNNIICKQNKEIEEYLFDNRIQFSFYFNLPHLVLGNLTNPFKYSLTENYFYLPERNYKYITYSMQKIQVKTDIGIAAEQFNFDLFSQSMNLYGLEQRKINLLDPYFFSVDITSSNYVNRYTRSYVKIQDILSNIGGFLESLKILFLVLTSIFTNYERSKIMVKNFFVYKDPFKRKSKQEMSSYVVNYIINQASKGKKNPSINVIKKNQKLLKSLKTIRDIEKIDFLDETINKIQEDNNNNEVLMNSRNNWNEGKNQSSSEQSSIKFITKNVVYGDCSNLFQKQVYCDMQSKMECVNKLKEVKEKQNDTVSVLTIL